MFDTSVVQANVVDTRGLSQDQLSGVMKNYADGNNEGIMSDLKALRYGSDMVQIWFMDHERPQGLEGIIVLHVFIHYNISPTFHHAEGNNEPIIQRFIIRQCVIQ